MLSAASTPVLAEPETAFVPDHAPAAVHAVALVDDQESVALPPLLTTVGVTAIATVGAGAIATLTDLAMLPPGPLQVSVKPVAPLSGPVLALPATARGPLQPPDAVQLEALVDDQVKLALPPLPTVVGDALSESVGAGAVTPTTTEFEADPPMPVQFRV